jgi:hypothetical protein
MLEETRENFSNNDAEHAENVTVLAKRKREE